MDKEQFDTLSKALSEMSKIKTTEWFSAYVIGASLLIAVLSLFYIRKQMLGDHGRSEKRLAVEMCIKWSEFVAPETSSVTRLIERLTPQQADAISELTKLEIEIKHRHDLINILQRHFPNIENEIDKPPTLNAKKGKYEIEGQHLQHIRYIAVGYLNMLESILLAWAEGIADHDVIVAEFSYLLDETKHRTAMEEFRKKNGFDEFPSIALFMEALREGKAANRAKVRRPAFIRRHRDTYASNRFTWHR